MYWPVAALTRQRDARDAAGARWLRAAPARVSPDMTGARVLAVSGRDNCQAFRWGEATWGVQFHPEFSVGMMRGYIRARADALRKEGTCPRELAQAVRPTPVARRVLRRFIHLARHRARNGA